jgi:hypothetical protein
VEELERVLKALRCAGLEMLQYRSPLGSLRWSASGLEAEKGSPGKEVGGGGHKGSPPLHVLRAPAAGIRGPARGGAGEGKGGPGSPPAGVITLLGEEEVAVPGRGGVVRWLVEEGGCVGYGQPLAWWREE